MPELDHRVALVTGGANGIGAAVADLLADHAMRIVILDVDADAAARQVAGLVARGVPARAVVGSVDDEDDVRRAVATAVEDFARLDVLVCCAAALHLLPHDRDIHTMSTEVWDATLSVNLKGVLLACKHAVPALIDSGGGSIVTLSSTAGLEGDLGRPAYAASKAAIVQLTRSVAAQYGKQGVRCNCVAPGLVLTERNSRNLPAQFVAMHERHSMTPYLGTPRDIAQVIAFLASDASRFVTGQLVTVDGGITAGSAVLADSRDSAR